MGDEKYINMDGLKLVREAIVEYFDGEPQNKHFALWTINQLHPTQETNTLMSILESEMILNHICPQCYSFQHQWRYSHTAKTCNNCDEVYIP